MNEIQSCCLQNPDGHMHPGKLHSPPMLEYHTIWEEVVYIGQNCGYMGQGKLVVCSLQPVLIHFSKF